MSVDTTAARPAIRPARRTTAQLLAAAGRDADAVSVFGAGTTAADTERAIFVVKGATNIQYLTTVLVRQGMLTAGKPVEG